MNGKIYQVEVKRYEIKGKIYQVNNTRRMVKKDQVKGKRFS